MKDFLYSVINKFTLLVWLAIYIVLIPIMLPIQFIVARLFNRDVKIPSLDDVVPNYELSTDKYNHDMSGYLTGDGSKFVGMSYVSRREEDWEKVTKFWNKDTREFYRHDQPEVGFSGDMLVGQLFAIMIRYKEGKLLDHEKNILVDIFYKFIYGQILPFSFTGSRGWLCMPWDLTANNSLDVLIMAKLGAKFTNNWYKKIMFYIAYWIMLIIKTPFYLLGHLGHDFWISGNIFFSWTYGEHSDVLIGTIAYVLDIPFGKKCLKTLSKRHADYNIDYAALAYVFLDEKERREKIYRILTIYDKYLEDGTEYYDIIHLETYYKAKDCYKNVIDWITGEKKFDSLKDMLGNPQYMSDTFLSGWAKSDYIWERNLHSGDQGYRRGDLDLLFPLYIMKGNLDFLKK